MKITREFWDWNGRKYIEIDHVPYKVPWRYNRVTGLAILNSTLPVQMLKLGTEVHVKYTLSFGVRVLSEIDVV